MINYLTLLVHHITDEVELKKISDLKFNNKLESVSLTFWGSKMIGSSFIRSLFDLNSLKYLNLKKCVLGIKDFEYLSKCLKNDSNLTELNLDGLFFIKIINFEHRYSFSFKRMPHNI